MSNYDSLSASTKTDAICKLIDYYHSLPDKEEEPTNMDYETFLRFFDKLREEERISIGEYVIKYKDEPVIRPDSYKSINYFRDDYMIGEDYIKEYYKLGEIMPTLDTSFDISGIKKYAKLKDYLDYLYKSNIEELKRQEQERERELLERQREEELKEKKLNDFLDIN
ncbi:hypothetical protein HOR18_gp191 [Staphylococcus phage vB_SscM-1]|uniref:Uncharacterized protein n=2 Tax=Sciuriunavirus SscM1 TaxID=2734053 RepID=A0A1X9I9U1_9CAUD|nr:hypothetical protein HOR18_gp191 [Staphylococcus phage vB_SscM-1]ANT44854.1 hypothetical protein vB_SscM-1_190 [Staphylococcus phage vB_SscM-1]ANT45056.1 hypothetical protein vB_SscM-2_189 [Staphylococcus phage vB_SscM-2]